MASLTPNARGSLYMALGSLAYVLNDAVVRLATEEGLGVYQVLCMRGIAMAVLFAAVGRARGEQVQRAHLERPALLRVLAEMVSTCLFFAALVRMEFANAQAILQFVPLAVTLAAAFVLRESVGTRRYAAILVGFIGVLVVIRPATEGFNIWSLAVIGSVATMVLRELATRNVAATTPGLSIAFMTAVGNTLLTGAIAVFVGWSGVTGNGLLLILLASCLLFFGYVFTIQSVRIGDLSASAPFRYTVLLGAVVTGYLLFDEVPDAFTLIGSALILGAGLYAIALDRSSPTRGQTRG